MSTVRLQLRRDSAADWTAANPVLRSGEPGWETDTSLLKVGDGVTAWNALAYYEPGSGGGGGAAGSPRCRVTPSAAQALAHDTNVILNFNTETYDAAGLHDSVTNNSRITLDRLGAWLIESQVGFATGTAGRRRVGILLNGAAWSYANVHAGTDQGMFVRNVAVVVCTTVGDYVQVEANQTNGSAINTSQAFTHFAATYLGP